MSLPFTPQFPDAMPWSSCSVAVGLRRGTTSWHWEQQKDLGDELCAPWDLGGEACAPWELGGEDCAPWELRNEGCAPWDLEEEVCAPWELGGEACAPEVRTVLPAT